MTDLNRRHPPCKGEGDETQVVSENGLTAMDSLASPCASPCEEDFAHGEGFGVVQEAVNDAGNREAEAVDAWLTAMAEADLGGLAAMLRGCLTIGQRRRLAKLLEESGQNSE